MINITCLLQIIHFCIGWYILDRFYFKPAISYLFSREQERRRLHDTVEAAEQSLAQERAGALVEQQAFSAYCKERMHIQSIDHAAILLVPKDTEHKQPILATAPLADDVRKELVQLIMKKATQ